MSVILMPVIQDKRDSIEELGLERTRRKKCGGFEVWAFQYGGLTLSLGGHIL
jgi:hypothetical protein